MKLLTQMKSLSRIVVIMVARENMESAPTVWTRGILHTGFGRWHRDVSATVDMTLTRCICYGLDVSAASGTEKKKNEKMRNVIDRTDSAHSANEKLWFLMVARKG